MDRISQITKRDVVVSSISAVVVAVITLSGQYFISKYQLDHQARTWEEQQRHVQVYEAEKRRRELVGEIRELHELLVHADMRFSIASEMDVIFSVMENETRGMGKQFEDEMASLKERLMRRLGIESRESMFAKSASEYSERQALFMRKLAEAENYFSDDISMIGAAYIKYHNMGDGNGVKRMEFWRNVVRKVISDFQDDGKIDQVAYVETMHQAIYSLVDRQRIVVDLYNALYGAMDKEVKELRCVGFGEEVSGSTTLKRE